MKGGGSPDGGRGLRLVLTMSCEEKEFAWTPDTGVGADARDRRGAGAAKWAPSLDFAARAIKTTLPVRNQN